MSPLCQKRGDAIRRAKAAQSRETAESYKPNGVMLSGGIYEVPRLAKYCLGNRAGRSPEAILPQIATRNRPPAAIS